jgi:hypothetical protein
MRNQFNAWVKFMHPERDTTTGLEGTE